MENSAQSDAGAPGAMSLKDTASEEDGTCSHQALKLHNTNTNMATLCDVAGKCTSGEKVEDVLLQNGHVKPPNGNGEEFCTSASGSIQKYGDEIRLDLMSAPNTYGVFHNTLISGSLKVDKDLVKTPGDSAVFLLPAFHQSAFPIAGSMLREVSNEGHASLTRSCDGQTSDVPSIDKSCRNLNLGPPIGGPTLSGVEPAMFPNHARHESYIQKSSTVKLQEHEEEAHNVAMNLVRMSQQLPKLEPVAQADDNPFAIKEIFPPYVDLGKDLGGSATSTGAAGVDNQLILSLAAVARSTSGPSNEADSCDDEYNPSQPATGDGTAGGLKVGGIQINLQALDQIVKNLGGFETVNDQKLWINAAEEMGIDSRKFKTGPSSLKSIFQQYILSSSAKGHSSKSPSQGDASSFGAVMNQENKLSPPPAPFALFHEQQDAKLRDDILPKSDVTGLKSGIFTDSNGLDRQDFSLFPRTLEKPADKDDERENKLTSQKVKREGEGKSSRAKSPSELGGRSDSDTSSRRYDRESSMKEEFRQGRESSAKSTHSSSRESEGGAKRKGKKDGDMAALLDELSDRKLSREERKMRAIMRQFELLEKKQRGGLDASGPGSGEGSPRRPANGELDVDPSSVSRKRKEQINDDVRDKERDKERNHERNQDRDKKEREREKEREKEKKERESERKERESEIASQAKKRSAIQIKESQPVQTPEAAGKKSRVAVKPLPVKVAKPQTKPKGKNGDERSSWATGPLAILREYRKAARRSFPCLPRVGKCDEPTVSHGRKAHILSSVADDIRSQSFAAICAGPLFDPAPYCQLTDTARLNPDRRVQDKKMFPVMKRFLSQWMQESKSATSDNGEVQTAENKDHDNCSHAAPEGSKSNAANIHALEQEDDSGICEMEIDQSPAASPMGRDLAQSDQSGHASSAGLLSETSKIQVGSIHPGHHLAQIADASTTGGKDVQESRHLGIADTLHLMAQNRRPHAGTAGKGSSGTFRPSPPLSPVSSEGIPSRNVSPLHRNGVDSGLSASSAAGSAHRAAPLPRVGASPRHRQSAWDVAPSGHGGDRSDRADSRDVRIPAVRDGSLHRESVLMLHRDPSPGQMLRRRPPSPPRPLFTGEIRERGLHPAEGGLSRESLRREREGLASAAAAGGGGGGGGNNMLARDRDRDRFFPLGVGGAGEIHSLRPSDRGLMGQLDLRPRSRSPGRVIERVGGGGLFVSDRLGLDRGGLERPGGLDRGGLVSLERGGLERSVGPGGLERGGLERSGGPGGLERGPGGLERGGLERGGPGGLERGPGGLERGGLDRSGGPGGLERGPGGLERGGLDRSGGPGGLERGPGGLERGGLDRSGGPGGQPGPRERSLSPRSKEALREMQVARERRAKEVMGEVMEPGEVDLGGSAGGGRPWNGPLGGGGMGTGRGADKWWPPGSGGGRLGGPVLGGGGAQPPRGGGPPGPGLMRRERPSMFDHRRGGR